MNGHRVMAVVTRHLYNFKRNYDRLADSIYWPVMDLLVWGLTTMWLQSSALRSSNFLLVMLTAIMFWQIVWRANYEISVNLLEESWSGNVVNLFSTPLRVSEWIAGVMVLGIIKVALSIVVAVTASWVLYHLNILKVGFSLLPFLVLLILFGWTLGFLGAGLIVRFGRQIQTVAWMMGFLFAPLSAVYYPVSVLPFWAQPASYMLPTTYVFEGMRTVLLTGEINFGCLISSLILNICYLALALRFFLAMFEHRRGTGLQGLD